MGSPSLSRLWKFWMRPLVEKSFRSLVMSFIEATPPTPPPRLPAWPSGDVLGRLAMSTLVAYSRRCFLKTLARASRVSPPPSPPPEV